jgi:phage FluMu protein Com
LAPSIPQLRIGVTRNRGFVYRACIRSPAAVTVGPSKQALCPIDDPECPDLHPLFEVKGTSCVLEFRRGWSLTMYRDGQAISGDNLISEGTAVLRGNRALLKMAPGSRGALYFGSTRLLFKWEELTDDTPGAVPLRDLGDLPRCHACGQVLANALAREGLLARCSSCRSMNRFVDPDAPYREDRASTTTEEESHGLAWRNADHGDATKDEADTLIGMPLFAPVTMNLEPLPAHLRPAGLPAEGERPLAMDAMTAASRMRTVFGRSPFLGPRVGRRETPDVPQPALLSWAKELPVVTPPGPATDTPETATTTPGQELPRIPEPVPETILTPAVADLQPVPELAVEAAESALKSIPRGRVQVAAIRPDAMETEGDPASSGFWTDEVGAEPPASLEIPALERAFYTSEVEALDWAEGGVVPWGTLTALSARTDFEEAAGRVLLGPEQEPSPPAISASTIEAAREQRARWSERLVLIALSALVGAGAAAAILLLLD